MSKPIDKLDFWKERIDTAVKEHYSVYVVHEAGWKNILKEHLDIIQKEMGYTAKVLDAGCGYGRMSEYFINYTGVDFSPDFIAKAKEKYPHKTFVEGNLKQLPFADVEFDWAFCVSIKRMVRDNLGDGEWDEMERELKRVAKKVLILEYEDPTVYEIL
jgi:ubiquinone/menaquinone biosynthesis C-methylase UbiE